MAEATTESWLDIVPALPLARGVPVRHSKHGQGVVNSVHSVDGEVRVTFEHGAGERYMSFWPDEHRAAVENCRVSELRISLDDPQGFGYAMRLLWPKSCSTPTVHDVKHGNGILDRHLNGTTTDADRLALAKALREVFGG